MKFSIKWNNAIPFNYFKNKSYKTTFILQMETDLDINNVILESYTIEIPKLNFEVNNIEKRAIKIFDTAITHNSIATKKFWVGIAVTVDNFLYTIMQTEQQLVEFNKVDYISLMATITYVINGIEKRTVLSWMFTPKLKKSNAFLDKFMSV